MIIDIGIKKSTTPEASVDRVSKAMLKSLGKRRPDDLCAPAAKFGVLLADIDTERAALAERIQEMLI